MKKVFLLIVISFLTACAFAQTFTRTLYLTDKGKQRMNGNDVKQLQQKLWDLGFTDVGEADGWFGPATESALKSFQALMGLEVDGVMGRQSFRCLYDTSDPMLNQYRQKIKEVNQIRNQKYLERVSCEDFCAYFSGSTMKYVEWEYASEHAYCLFHLYLLSGNSRIFFGDLCYGMQNDGWGIDGVVDSEVAYKVNNKWYKVENGKFTPTDGENYDGWLEDSDEWMKWRRHLES